MGVSGCVVGEKGFVSRRWTTKSPLGRTKRACEMLGEAVDQATTASGIDNVELFRIQLLFFEAPP